VASPKSELWWVLWVCVYPWFICAPKCSNYALTNLFLGLCRFVWVSEVLVNLHSPHPEALEHPSTPKMLWTNEHAPTLSPSVVFTFGLVIESIKELGGASHGIKALVELDSFLGEFWWNQRGLVSQYKRPWWKNPPRT